MGKEMESFQLNTGASIPAVGLGTWQAAPGLVGAAVEAAVKVGAVLKKLFDEGVVKREDLFITSKLWNANHSPEDVKAALEGTLRDLQIDYVDLYLIHWPVRFRKGAVGSKPDNVVAADIPETWRAMEALYDEGKARAIGVSNFSSKKLGDLIEIARIPPAVLQVECHPHWQQPKLHEFCKSKGVHLTGGVVFCFQGYSPLGSPGTVWFTMDVLKNPILNMVAEKVGKTPAQVALRWGLQMGHSVLPKSTNVSRIKENLEVLDWSIPDDLFAKLSEMEQVGFNSFDRCVVIKANEWKR
ncbi:unnamed protein product [Linum tenue]|uniref:NADP-dependent oxidoreductase domain-containing protein n=2 Tax=Linum tenue TaxID=586396 RepID=A0AAV0KZR7_9ROSI|nr:unnamed protein product [Linum tenue]